MLCWGTSWIFSPTAERPSQLSSGLWLLACDKFWGVPDELLQVLAPCEMFFPEEARWWRFISLSISLSSLWYCLSVCDFSVLAYLSFWRDFDVAINIFCCSMRYSLTWIGSKLNLFLSLAMFLELISIVWGVYSRWHSWVIWWNLIVFPFPKESCL